MTEAEALNYLTRPTIFKNSDFYPKIKKYVSYNINNLYIEFPKCYTIDALIFTLLHHYLIKLQDESLHDERI